MTEAKEFDVDIFSMKVRIQEAGTYKKDDGTIGKKRDGITLTANGNYLPISALQLAGLLTMFQAGTEARKELVRRIQLEQAQQADIAKMFK